MTARASCPRAFAAALGVLDVTLPYRGYRMQMWRHDWDCPASPFASARLARHLRCYCCWLPQTTALPPLLPLVLLHDQRHSERSTPQHRRRSARCRSAPTPCDSTAARWSMRTTAAVRVFSSPSLSARASCRSQRRRRCSAASRGAPSGSSRNFNRHARLAPIMRTLVLSSHRPAGRNSGALLWQLTVSRRDARRAAALAANAARVHAVTQ